MNGIGKVWRFVCSAKVLMALVVIATLAGTFNLAQFRDAYANWPPGGKPTLASHFATWDSAHYLRLSVHGYHAGSNSCAFYPLWPAVVHLAALATGGRPLVASLVLANGLSLLAFWLFYGLVERHYGSTTGRTALILLLACPGALFFSFPYSESLYFVLVLLFFWGLELERWTWTGISGFLLPLTRPLGIFVVLPLAWYFWERNGFRFWRRTGIRVERPARAGGQSGTATEALVDRAEQASLAGPDMRTRRRSRWITPGLLMLCPLLGYAAYFGIMYASTGNAFAGFAAQRFYPNSPSIRNMFNLTGFTNALLNIHSVGGMMDGALDRVFFLLFLGLLPLIYRLNRVWFFYVLPAGLVPALTSWFMSYRRYFMLLFPAFVVLAQLLVKTKSRWLFWYYVVLLAALQAWAVEQFINFNWAG